MNYVLALIPTRLHDRAKAVIGLLGLALTLALALPSAPAWLPILAATLTAYGIYQVPNTRPVLIVEDDVEFDNPDSPQFEPETR